MSQTSSNSNESPIHSHNFIPKELPMKKDINDISRTVYTHLLNLERLLNDWIKIQDKGNKIARSITSLKLHECTAGYYPQALKPLAMDLVEILTSLQHITEGVETIDKQLQALAKIQSNNDPVINSSSVAEISEAVSNINKNCQKEYKLKETITENIAHCRDENLIEVYASAWEFDMYSDLQSNTAYLFAEVGLPGIM